MSTVTDKALITELQNMIGQAKALRDGLYTRRPGCVCDERGLCAHHAEVHNRLVTVADDLAKVIRAAQREE